MRCAGETQKMPGIGGMLTSGMVACTPRASVGPLCTIRCDRAGAQIDAMAAPAGFGVPTAHMDIFCSMPSPSSFPIVSAQTTGKSDLSLIQQEIRRQKRSVQERNQRFVESERPHILMLNSQGYAGPRFPFGATDSGGQVQYVNDASRALAAIGFKVTIVARAFHVDGKYEKYGNRRGVAFFDEAESTPDNETMIRYIYAPGVKSGFVRKEEIFGELPLMGEHLKKLLTEEARSRGLEYWDPKSVWVMNSHYADGGWFGTQITRDWAKQILAQQLSKTFAPIIREGGLDPDCLRDNPEYYLGCEVCNAYLEAHGQEGPFTALSKCKLEIADVLGWAADRMGWNAKRRAKLLQGIAKRSFGSESLVTNSVDAYDIGNRLLGVIGKLLKELKTQLVTSNRHSWTPHSIGKLKDVRLKRTGDDRRDLQRYHELYMQTRMFFEAQLERRGYDPLKNEWPPAAVYVETSMEIGEAGLWNGRSPKKMPAVPFVPGYDPERNFPRTSLRDEGVQRLIRYLGEELRISRSILEKDLLGNPQKVNVLVEASRMDNTKRKHMVIDTYAHLSNAVKQSTFLFITGPKTDEEPEIFEGLEAQIDRLDLGRRVFLVKRVPEGAIGALLGLPHGNQVDQFRLAAFLFCSRMEGWGMAPHEGAVGGLPLIASPHTPCATYARYQNDGALVVDSDELSDYVTAVEQMIENPDAARELARRGRDALKRFTWNNVTQDYVLAMAKHFGLSLEGLRFPPRDEF